MEPVFGFALYFVAVVAIAVVAGKRGLKCPFCAEAVRKEAVKCKHCHSELPSAVVASTPAVSTDPDEYLQTMEHYGITFSREKYWFGEYAYDKLSDAVNYAVATRAKAAS